MNVEKVSLHDTALIIFARYPTPGKVKTRLAATLGIDRATAFYRACAGHVFQQCTKLSKNVMRHLFYADREDSERVREWAGNEFVYADQGAGDLGERMSNAFAMVFREGAQKAIIIGTDVPDISAETINDAIQALDRYDIAIGPSHDGGYYLLGMKQLQKEIFSSIKWGSENVFRETMKRLEANRLSIHRLPALADIDTEDDLRKWYASASQDAPLTKVVKDLLVHA